MMFGSVPSPPPPRSGARACADPEPPLALPSSRRTDHPFFPPLSEDQADAKWESVVQNLEAIETAGGWDADDVAAVRGGNAARLFKLDL